jgi:hypothetical protein
MVIDLLVARVTAYLLVARVTAYPEIDGTFNVKN